MSKNLHWCKFNMSDWLAGAASLTLVERGMYITLIALMYDRAGPVEETENLYFLFGGITRASFSKVLAGLIEAGKIRRCDGGLWNDRVEKELREKNQKSVKNSDNVNNGRWKKTEKNQQAHDTNVSNSYQSRIHILEARYQKLETSPKSPSFDAVDAALRSIPGLSDHAVAVDPVIAPIWQLVEQGYDLHRQILPSISRQLAKRGNRRVSRWSFFVPGIVDDSRTVAPAGATPANGFALSDDAWRKVLDAGRAKRAWQTERYGPKPSEPGCRVPPALLHPGDGEGWTEWKASA